MNWEAIGAIGEILGALAVFSSLVYLANQIRAQNRESRIASVHELTEAYRDMISVLQYPEMADLFVEALDNFDDLTPSKRIRFVVLMLSGFRIFEDGYFQWRQITRRAAGRFRRRAERSRGALAKRSAGPGMPAGPIVDRGVASDACGVRLRESI